MQAFAVVRLQIRLVALLVVPRLIAATRLHRRQDTNHARLLAALLQYLLDPLFLAKLLGAPHELDPDGIIGGNLLHVLAQRIA